jgi:hypothetical protein
MPTQYASAPFNHHERVFQSLIVIFSRAVTWPFILHPHIAPIIELESGGRAIGPAELHERRIKLITSVRRRTLGHTRRFGESLGVGSLWQQWRVGADGRDAAAGSGRR